MSSTEASTVNAIWDGVLGYLRSTVANADYFAWFVGARALDIDEQALTVALANDYAVRFVRGKFQDRLETAASHAMGRPIGVVLVSREAGAGPGRDVSGSPAGAADRVAIVEAGTAGAETDARAREAMADLAAAFSVREAGLPLEPSSPAASAADSFTAEQLRAESTRPFQVSGGQDVVDADNTPMPVIRRRIAPDLLDTVVRLNPRYRFDTFVIGEANQLAHAAALSVAEAPGQAYNPLFIHGGTGLGKTHLLHAIGQYVEETNPDMSVAYVTSESFVRRFIHAISQGYASREARERFKQYFRGVDVLLMDDVQLLSGKSAALQEELFHTFNEIQNNGGQIVLTSDCEPASIKELEERLISRFGWGLIADIEAPDRETRIAILRKRARADGLEIPDDVTEEIAERVATNVRELEGALTRVVAYGSLSGRRLTRSVAAEVLASFIARAPSASSRVTIDRIQQTICDYFGITREDLVGPRRSQDVVRPRWIAMYLSRTLLPATSTQVGKRFGDRDHTTVLNACAKIEEQMQRDREVYDLVAQLQESIRSGKVERVHASR